jgi:SAM-dependent methyltransferase
MPSFEHLVAEGASVPVDGWDFSWFSGRATEERPSWGYARLIGERMAAVRAGLDVQTGGGEVLATIPNPPPLLVATESWAPNVAIAHQHLRPLGGQVVQAADDRGLPFATGTFDLVTSRHPTVTGWDEIARVLRPGGAYLSQQVGAGSNHELIEYLMGPQPIGTARDPRLAAERAEAAGLRVAQLRTEALRAEFHDIGAVVHFLRKVLWTVPDFSVGKYKRKLGELHERIASQGPFVTTVHRFLIEARKA